MYEGETGSDKSAQVPQVTPKNLKSLTLPGLAGGRTRGDRVAQLVERWTLDPKS